MRERKVALVCSVLKIRGFSSSSSFKKSPEMLLVRLIPHVFLIPGSLASIPFVPTVPIMAVPARPAVAAALARIWPVDGARNRDSPANASPLTCPEDAHLLAETPLVDLSASSRKTADAHIT